MKRATIVTLFAAFFLSTLCVDLLFAEDVYVRGYYRKDGTYVRPHIRSSPDSYRWNNYGPSRNSYELMNPRTRDNDLDGTPNYLDWDSDNDLIGDDFDTSPYSTGGDWFD
jgi:hypothetical protein